MAALGNQLPRSGVAPRSSGSLALAPIRVLQRGLACSMWGSPWSKASLRFRADPGRVIASPQPVTATTALRRGAEMRACLPVVAILALVCGAYGCSTDAAVPSVSPPTAEACPQTFNACVGLCQPKGVRHFGCWSAEPGEAFECECLDGSTPAQPSAHLTASLSDWSKSPRLDFGGTPR